MRLFSGLAGGNRMREGEETDNFFCFLKLGLIHPGEEVLSGLALIFVFNFGA